MRALGLFVIVAIAITAGAIGPATAEIAEAAGGTRVESLLVAKAPRIDGRGDDPAWGFATAIQVQVREVAGSAKGRTALVTLKSVRTKTHLYFLASWADATRDASHKTWVWNPKTDKYEQGDDREDVFALAFEHTGVFNPDMRSGLEAVWDVWQWKAARTDPAGYALDKTHRFEKTKPRGKARSFDARDGSTIWISRPEDEGDSPQKRQPAPSKRGEDRVAQYVKGKPSGSAADVRAKGLWVDGRWTVEFARRLSTGHPDDTAFDIRRSCKMGLAVFDREEHANHSASGAIELSFTKAPPAGQNFDGLTTDALPPGWKVEATNARGSLADWSVRKDADAPSLPNVLSLTRIRDTAVGVFNLCWDRSADFKDGVIEVKCRANSGRVDQGGGLIWRARDADNYYVARYNPLESNFRLYYVKDGARTMLANAPGIKIEARVWFDLKVVHRGEAIEGWLNGKKLLETKDGTFTKAGGIGVWTKADAATSFDNLLVRRDSE